jgi:hypothetical protein
MFWWMNFDIQAETDSPSRRAACSAKNAAVDSSVKEIFVVAIDRAYLSIAFINTPQRATEGSILRRRRTGLPQILGTRPTESAR